MFRKLEIKERSVGGSPLERRQVDYYFTKLDNSPCWATKMIPGWNKRREKIIEYHASVWLTLVSSFRYTYELASSPESTPPWQLRITVQSTEWWLIHSSLPLFQNLRWVPKSRHISIINPQFWLHSPRFICYARGHDCWTQGKSGVDIGRPGIDISEC